MIPPRRSPFRFWTARLVAAMREAAPARGWWKSFGARASLLALALAGASWLPVAPPPAEAPAPPQPPGLDRALFFAAARELPPEAQSLARAYVADIDQIESSGLRGRAAAQFATSELTARFGYATDMEVWGVEDYWTTPLEFIGKGRGDCEDFAIAALYMLSSAGIPKESMRMAYARLNTGAGILPHMVLLLADGREGWWAIDNTQSSVERVTDRPDLAIVFTFDESHIYLGSSRSVVADAPSRISKWRDVLAKIHQEGFR